MIRPGKHGLHRSIAAVPHPAIQIALPRMVLDKGAEADALHPAVDDDVPDDADTVHIYVPVIAFPTITQL
jgi:hypothetical protein